MRNVYPSDGIAHLWAHQAQQSARNQQGNFYFTGRVLYSYRDSYPIANILDSPRKGCKDKLVLIQENTYSHTTSNQIQMARQSVNHMTSVTVPQMLHRSYDHKTEHERNIQWFHERIKEATDKVLKARTNVEWRLHKLNGLVRDANLYAHFFKLRAKFKNEISADNIEAMKVKARAADKAKIAREIESTRRRNAQQAKADAIARPIAQAKLAAWRNGGPMPTREDARVLGLKREETGDLLRINGDVIETSQGAEFPVSHARLGLALVKRVMDTGVPWYTNGHTLHLGHYKIDMVTGDGTVYAGCHIVKWAEIERIAERLEQ